MNVGGYTYARDAEGDLLSACLLFEDAADEAVESLKPSSFIDSTNAVIFAAIRELIEDGKPVNQVSVRDRLLAKGDLERIGGVSTLVELSSNEFSYITWRSALNSVKRDSALRDLRCAAATIEGIANDCPDSVEDALQQAETALLAVSSMHEPESVTPIENIIDDAVSMLKKGRSTVIDGVPTGFGELDDLFCGFKPGQFVIIAARPGVGKSTFASNIAVNAAMSGHPIVAFSLEMSKELVVQRMLQYMMDLMKQTDGFGKGFSTIDDAASILRELDIKIDDTAGLTPFQLRSRTRRALRGKKEGLAIVDYLQLMEPSSRRPNPNRTVEVGDISRACKVMAKDLGIPVIALSQLSRAIEKRGGDKRPMLSDLRESGSIEQDADIVMFLDRSFNEDESMNDGRPDIGEARIIVSKHRNGALRDIKLEWHPEGMAFRNPGSGRE